MLHIYSCSMFMCLDIYFECWKNIVIGKAVKMYAANNTMLVHMIIRGYKR